MGGIVFDVEGQLGVSGTTSPASKVHDDRMRDDPDEGQRQNMLVWKEKKSFTLLKAEISYQSDAGVVFLKVNEDWVEGSGDGSVCSECKLARVQAGLNAVLYERTTFSKHFIRVGVRATGWQSFRLDTADFLGTGMMVTVSKQMAHPLAAWHMFLVDSQGCYWAQQL